MAESDKMRGRIASMRGDVGGPTKAGRTMLNRRAKSSRAARVGRVDVEKRVDRLARSVAQIEVALPRAEGEIEADARPGTSAA